MQFRVANFGSGILRMQLKESDHLSKKKNIALLFKFIDKSRTRPASFYFRFFIIMYVVVIGAIE